MTIEQRHVVYHFGPFRFEPREHLLLRNQQQVAVTAKALATLQSLVERHGSLITKRDLMEAVWPNTSVEENNLDRNISTLRKALGEQSNGEPYIETVPRIGYRFVATVTESKPNRPLAFAPVPIRRQDIRYCRTRDNVQLAYSMSGSGVPMVRVAGSFSHLTREWESPVWRHWVRDLPEGYALLRYDQRGSGLSDWDVEDISFESWVEDLETVVDAAQLDTFVLYGPCQGGAVAIEYALRHPERVRHLVLWGAYSRGILHRGDPGAISVRRAVQTLVRSNWGRGDPAGYQVVTDTWMPDGANAEDKKGFNELQKISTSAHNLARSMEACDNIQVRRCLQQIAMPTIVFHAERDRIAPVEEGKILAAEIPGARFVPLPTGNHILLSHEPSWEIFTQELSAFLGVAAQATAG